MRLLSNLEGMSAYLCAEFLGVDLHGVLKHIKSGLLNAEIIRYDSKGKATYYIKEKDLRTFITNNLGVIDLRKVEKYFFIELVANGRVHQSTLDRAKYAPASGVAKGAYILADAENNAPDILLLATGSEISLCIMAY